MLRITLASFAILLSTVSVSAPRAQEPGSSADTEGPDSPVDYLVIYADDYKEIAQQWADYRTTTGYITETLAYSKVHATPSLDALKLKIQKLHEASSELQVLLIGGCPDAGSKTVNMAREIPWRMSSYKDASPRLPKSVPSDNFLADTIKDNAGKTDIAIGRIPARTKEEALLAFSKVKLYESSESGDWMRNLTFFAGEGRFGPIVDGMIEKLFTEFMSLSVDPAFDVRMTYANIRSDYSYIPTQFSSQVIKEANAGGLILTYIGHGLYDRLDNMQVKIDGETKRFPILSVADVKDFNIKDGKLPVMMIVACQTGYMDHKEGCLAEAVIFQKNAPVAVVASSRDSHPYSNILFQKTFTESVVGECKTLGAAFLAAKRELIEAKDPKRSTLDIMALAVMPDKKDRDRSNEAHLRLYNLVGDPGLQLRKASAKVFIAKGDKGPESSKSIRVDFESEFELGLRFTPQMCVEFKDGAKVEGIEIRLCRARDSRSPDLKGFKKGDLFSSDDEVRKVAEAVLTSNHAASNDKVMSDVGYTLKAAHLGDDDASVIYTVKLGPGVAPGGYILKVFALDDEKGFVAIDSTPLTVRKKR